MARYLIFTLPDGSYCQITGIRNTTCQDMVKVMEFLLEKGVNYDAFSMDYGDSYTWGTLEDYPSAFPGCIPEPSEEGLHWNEASLKLKNGVPYMLLLNLVDENQPDTDSLLTWRVYAEPQDTSYSIGDYQNITKEALSQALDNQSEVGFLYGEYYITIQVYEDDFVDTAYQFITSLKAPA